MNQTPEEWQRSWGHRATERRVVNYPWDISEMDNATYNRWRWSRGINDYCGLRGGIICNDLGIPCTGQCLKCD